MTGASTVPFVDDPKPWVKPENINMQGLDIMEDLDDINASRKEKSDVVDLLDDAVKDDGDPNVRAGMCSLLFFAGRWPYGRLLTFYVKVGDRAGYRIYIRVHPNRRLDVFGNTVWSKSV